MIDNNFMLDIHVNNICKVRCLIRIVTYTSNNSNNFRSFSVVFCILDFQDESSLAERNFSEIIMQSVCDGDMLVL